MARDEFSRERRRKPLHPRANQGLGLVMLGITVGVIGAAVAASADGGWVIASVGGFLMLAGVIVYAASPSWIDWTPPEGYKGWTSKRDGGR